MDKPPISKNPNKKIYQVGIGFISDTICSETAEEMVANNINYPPNYLTELYSVVAGEYNTQEKGMETMVTFWIVADYHSEKEAEWVATGIGENSDSPQLKYMFVEEPQIIGENPTPFTISRSQHQWLKKHPGVFKDFLEYHKLYGVPLEGSSRVAYMDYAEQCVYKIPYTDRGLQANRLEAKLSQLYEQGDKVTPVAACALYESGSAVPYLKMEMVNKAAVWQHYKTVSNMPEWAKDIIDSQVGIDPHGRLVAYDLS